MSKDCERYCTVQESLRESLKEMQLIRQGKMKRRTWEDVMESLKEDIKEIEEENYEQG